MENGMIDIAIAAGWLSSCAAAFLLYRADSYRDKGFWTRADRRFALLISLFGPISLLGGLVIWFVNIDDDTIAKW